MKEIKSAEELRDIVADVPSKAAPLWYEDGFHYSLQMKDDKWAVIWSSSGLPTCYLPLSLAVMIWEASMTAYLVDAMKGITIGPRKDGWYGVCDAWSVPNVKTKGETRVEALAEACKAYTLGASL